MSEDPYRSYNFIVEIEGAASAGFVECAGLGAEVDVIAYREGGANAAIRHLPGQVRYHPLTLRYGVTRSSALWDWFRTSAEGRAERRNVSVILLEADGAAEGFRWNLFDAWISAWSAGRLDARTSEVAIESMTLVYDRVERD